ncbi:MAG: hypothetical protein K6E65_08675 [Olsenella sp.]|jgi:hypothetical protein|nr:hypothetical protein [Olsenella sp.]
MDADLYSAVFGDFGPLVTLIIAIAVSILAILKFGVNFNLNDFLSSRKERHLLLARMYCPHMRFTAYCDEKIEAQSLLYSPSGTPNWVCRQCGTVMPTPPGDDEWENAVRYYIAHPEVYKKRMKMFAKHARKSF